MPLNPQQFETCSALRPQLSPRRAQLRRGDPDARALRNFALFFFPPPLLPPRPSSLLFILAGGFPREAEYPDEQRSVERRFR